ncbi:hypothetical protein HYS47_00690 [Candidatus Woesearchaeota archaeon]|nr:hypothetical protein [Candidatus Woesearchaeota archaeon]
MKKFKHSKKNLSLDQPAPKKGMSSKAILSIILAAIMGVSIIGFVSTNIISPTTEYNNIKFRQTPAGWVAEIQGEEMLFTNHPLDVEHLNVSAETTAALRDAKIIYVTSAVNDSLRESISQTTYDLIPAFQKKNVYAVLSFTENTTYSKPVVTCNNATAFVPVVYFHNSTTTQITSQNNCIIAEANAPLNMIKIRDRLMYAVLGIIS